MCKIRSTWMYKCSHDEMPFYAIDGYAKDGGSGEA